MAGIGFRLRSLSEQENLLAPVASIGHAAIIAAGPWIFTVVALALVDRFTSSTVPIAVLDSSRLLIIYAFALSLLGTSPIVIVATRLVGDAIYARSFDRIRSIFLAALLLAGGAAALAALVTYRLIFAVPDRLLIAGVSCCALVGLIWVAMAFCGAVRDFQGITLAFLVGLVVAAVGTIGAALTTANVVAMSWAFNAGMIVIFCGLAGRILATFPQPVMDLKKATLMLLRGLRHFWCLTLGGLFAAVGIWIDKWVVWAGPAGRVDETGLVHAPLYDGAMFISALAIIPALALFVTHIETTFFQKYVAYYKAINDHATLQQIEDNSRGLEKSTLHSLTQIIVVQATLSAIVVLCAPLIVQATGLYYQQIGIIRLGVLGAVFQFLFFALTSLLVFFGRHARFLFLQAAFAVAQGTLTAITLKLGETYYGFGYLIACVLTGMLALGVVVHTFQNLTFVTFVLGSLSDSAEAYSSDSNRTIQLRKDREQCDALDER